MRQSCGYDPPTSSADANNAMNRMLQPLAALNAQAWPYLAASAAIITACIAILWNGGMPSAYVGGIDRALQGGTLCALATALGAMPVLLVRRLPQVLADTLLGFGAGVMLAATAFSLVLPALESAQAMGHSPWSAGGLVSAGLMVGAIALLVLGKVMSDEPLQSPHSDAGQLVPTRVIVFVLAIMLHNIPEGMAVGVAAGGGLPEANGLAMGIALQDLPEGMVVALILAGVGMTRAKAVFIGMLSGVVEPLAAVASAWALGISAHLLPWGLAFAAGAMLVAVGNSVIPESTRNGNGVVASLGLALGFCVMMVLDTALV